MKTRFKAAASVPLALSLVMLAACGNNSGNASTPPSGSSANASETAPPASAKKESVTLTFATINDWTTQGTGMIEAFKKYEEATGNKIKVEVYPGDQFYNIIKTKLATGDVPDFYAVNAGESYVPYNGLEPLEGPWVDKMVEPVREQVTRKSDGKVTMAYFSPLGYFDVIYNKEVFRKAGVKVPLMNYQELMAANEAIADIGVTPIYLLGKEGWTAAQIAYDAGVYALNDPAVAEKLQKNEVKPSEIPEFMEMSERFLSLKPYINKDFMSLTYATGIDAVVKGEAAMTFLFDSLYGEVAQKYPDQVNNLSMMPVTLADDYISAVSSYDQRAFAVPSAAKHKEEAKEAINFFMEPEMFKTLIAPMEGGSPYEGYEISMNQWQKDMESMLKTHNIPLSGPMYVGFGDVAYGPVSQPFQEILSGKSIKSALNDWYKEYAKLNKAQKTPGF